MPSRVPKELNENWGRNYGLDGFSFDMDYGHNLHVNISPGTGSLSGLPGDLVASQDDPVDETAFAFEKSDLGDMGVTAALGAPKMPSDGVVDHHWLSDAQQDPARLPRIIDSMTQLQNLWGDRTDGFFRVPAVDRIEDVVERKEIHEEEKIASTVQRIIRAYSQGMRDEDILPEIGEALWSLASPWVREASADRGLLGNVYVYAGSYPGLTKGKWAQEFKKVSKRAQYLVVPRTVPASAMARLGSALGMKVVSSTEDIPWIDELEARTGVRASSAKEAKQKLAEHLNADPVRLGLKPLEGHRPIVTMPSQRVSSDEARRAFDEHRPKPRAVISAEVLEGRYKKKIITAYLDRWVSAGLLPQAKAQDLLQSDPNSALQKAARWVARKGLPKQGSYRGISPDRAGEVSQDLAWRALESARKLQHAASLARLESSVKAAAARDFQARRDALGRMVRAGWIDASTRDRLLASKKSTRDVLRIAESIAATPKEAAPFSGRHFLPESQEVTATQVDAALADSRMDQERRNEAIRQRSAAERLEAKLKRLAFVLDQGTVGEDFVRHMKATLTREEAKQGWVYLKPLLQKAAQKTTVVTPTYKGRSMSAHAMVAKPSRVLSTLEEVQRHLAEGMHQGLTGRLLTASLASKVPLDELKGYAPQIREYRQEHEGRMGQTYIDAAHFASARGIRGCEEGAARTHASTVEGVLAMEECKTCVAFDGTHGRCMTYSRPMLWDVPAKSLLRTPSREASDTQQQNPVEAFGLQGSVVVDAPEKVAQESHQVTFGKGMIL